jgi:hypothetical protein
MYLRHYYLGTHTNPQDNIRDYITALQRCYQQLSPLYPPPTPDYPAGAEQESGTASAIDGPVAT